MGVYVPSVEGGINLCFQFGILGLCYLVECNEVAIEVIDCFAWGWFLCKEECSTTEEGFGIALVRRNEGKDMLQQALLSSVVGNWGFD